MRLLVLAFGLLLDLACAAMPRPAEAVHFKTDVPGFLALGALSSVWEFDLPLSPVPTDFVLGEYFQTEVIFQNFFGNGIDTPLIFLSSNASPPFDGQGGGFYMVVAGIVGHQLYTGSEDAPTFLPGVYNMTVYGSEISATLTISTPEPASLALLGVGLMGFGIVRRRRA